MRRNKNILHNSQRMSTVHEMLQSYALKTLTIPDFQRHYIWSPKTQRMFIDSILRKYTIPAITVWSHENEDGDLIEEVIDGQQRLYTLYRFKENQFPFRIDKKDPLVTTVKEIDDLAGQNVYYNKVPPGKEGITLSKDLRQRFRNTEIGKSVIYTEDEKHVRAVFRRMNTASNRLSGQEVLNAVYRGAYRTFVYDSVYDITGSGTGGLKWLSKKERVFSKPKTDRMGRESFYSVLMTGLHFGVVQEKNKRVEEMYESFDIVFPDKVKNKLATRFKAIWHPEGNLPD